MSWFSIIKTLKFLISGNVLQFQEYIKKAIKIVNQVICTCGQLSSTPLKSPFAFILCNTAKLIFYSLALVAWLPSQKLPGTPLSPRPNCLLNYLQIPLSLRSRLLCDKYQEVLILGGEKRWIHWTRIHVEQSGEIGTHSRYDFQINFLQLDCMIAMASLCKKFSWSVPLPSLLPLELPSHNFNLAFRDPHHRDDPLHFSDLQKLRLGQARLLIFPKHNHAFDSVSTWNTFFFTSFWQNCVYFLRPILYAMKTLLLFCSTCFNCIPQT